MIRNLKVPAVLGLTPSSQLCVGTLARFTDRLDKEHIVLICYGGVTVSLTDPRTTWHSELYVIPFPPGTSVEVLS